MKIHIDGVNLSSTTGPNSFGLRLSKQLMLMGHELDFSSGVTSDVSLVFIEPTGVALAKKVVQRIDGIWSKAKDIDTMNQHIRRCYVSADAVVFQSAFDMRYINSLWGQPPKTGLFRVINNGIDKADREPSAFDIKGLRSEFDKVFVCSASWHRQKRLVENIECFQALQEHYPKSCLVVLGDPDVTIAHKAVFYAGRQPHSTCLQFFEDADWMINLEYFSHSPNAVVEALSVGCPVICMQDGGCAELVKEYGVIVYDRNEAHTVERNMGKPVEYDRPPKLHAHQKLKRLPERFELGPHADIDIVNTAKQYVELFDKTIAL